MKEVVTSTQIALEEDQIIIDPLLEEQSQTPAELWYKQNESWAKGFGVTSEMVQLWQAAGKLEEMFAWINDTKDWDTGKSTYTDLKEEMLM